MMNKRPTLTIPCQPDHPLRIASLFGDHAILQCHKPVPVWGWTDPLTRVDARLGSTHVQGLSNADGYFCLRLPPMKPGGPFELEVSVSDFGHSVLSKDLFVGEVWIASGQSNMEWTFQMLGPDGAADVAAANDSLLRMLTLPKNAILGGRSSFDAQWEVFQPSKASDFSAVATYFARKLREELGVAVGIVNASWGGTPVEAWISRNWLAKNPFSRSAFARYESNINSPGYWSAMDDLQKNGLPADPGNRGETGGWALADAGAPEWKAVHLPNPWQAFGHSYSGVFWFKKTIDIPVSWEGRELVLHLGAIDKQDTTYFNGLPIGSTGIGFEEEHWNSPREYSVPREVVKAGRATIAVRVYSFVYQGGMVGPAEQMKLSLRDSPGESLPLAGEWQYRVEQNFGIVSPPSQPWGNGNPNTPAILHESMIAPILPYAQRGAIWYQGESNAERAREYRSLLVDMIRNWRLDWGQGDFPFLVVQLANYRSPAEYEEGSHWAKLREAQLKVLDEPGTALAVTIDIGDAADIHPKNKRDVGERLALCALSKAYSKPTAFSGPTYREHFVEGNGIRLHFDHVADGLASRGGDLRTFVIAGENRVFHPATATVEGNTLFVSAALVPSPVAVRYAWADNPHGCNLINSTGLPASPFRTDSWP